MFETVGILVVLASVFGFLNYHMFKLPFGIAMMVSGLAASILVLIVDAAAPGLGLGAALRELVLTDVNFSEALMRGMLSFLLFAGALHTDIGVLKKWLKPILTLASVGVVISTTIIGFGSWAAFNALGLEVPLIWCLVFGSLITPTDPVAVLGIMKAAGAPKSVEMKVVGESLFNDGVGVVLFTVLVTIAVGSGGAGGEVMDVTSVTVLVGQEVLGGLILGAIAGYVSYFALRDMDEPNLETLITVAIVAGTSLLAFKLHTSAPLACVVAGLFVGNKGREHAMSEDTEESLDRVWSFIDETLNAILFLLVGLEVVAFEFSGQALIVAAIMIVLNLVARSFSVLGPITIWRRFMDFVPGTRRILVWGGIKGGISVALALSLPEFPGREYVLTATYAVVVTSVFVQGLTVGKLIEIVVTRQKSEVEEAWSS